MAVGWDEVDIQLSNNVLYNEFLYKCGSFAENNITF